MSSKFPSTTFASPSLRAASAFSLIEIMLVVSLLSLIVFALMSVFSSTQTAFRASVTQSDVLEGGRAAIDLIASDIKQITPSGEYSNGPANFFARDNNTYVSLDYTPLQQSLPGGTVLRTNFLNYFCLLARENMKWKAIGYAVNSTNQSPLYPLYRYYAETNISTPPLVLVNNFLNIINNGQWTNLSHVVDGVVHLVVQPDDLNGYAMTNTYQVNAGQLVTNYNVSFFRSPYGTVGFYFYSNTVPASVELELGVLEDRTLQRTESRPTTLLRAQYLADKSGNIHLFRQHVTIPNVDPTAYK